MHSGASHCRSLLADERAGWDGRPNVPGGVVAIGKPHLDQPHLRRSGLSRGRPRTRSWQPPEREPAPPRPKSSEGRTVASGAAVSCPIRGCCKQLDDLNDKELARIPSMLHVVRTLRSVSLTLERFATAAGATPAVSSRGGTLPTALSIASRARDAVIRVFDLPCRWRVVYIPAQSPGDRLVALDHTSRRVNRPSRSGVSKTRIMRPAFRRRPANSHLAPTM